MKTIDYYKDNVVDFAKDFLGLELMDYYRSILN